MSPRFVMERAVGWISPYPWGGIWAGAVKQNPVNGTREAQQAAGGLEGETASIWEKHKWLSREGALSFRPWKRYGRISAGRERSRVKRALQAERNKESAEAEWVLKDLAALSPALPISSWHSEQHRCTCRHVGTHRTVASCSILPRASILQPLSSKETKRSICPDKGPRGHPAQSSDFTAYELKLKMGSDHPKIMQPFAQEFHSLPQPLSPFFQPHCFSKLLYPQAHCTHSSPHCRAL